MMKLKELEAWLQDVNGFEIPKIQLEQYETPVHIAARMIHTIESSFGDLEGKVVADLGCGCGVLMIGCALLEASAVFGFDVDNDALKICQRNLEEMEIKSAEIVQMDIKDLATPDSRFLKMFDTVVLNPPFGTKRNQGTDMEFLRVALSLSKSAVYSLHKSATRAHVTKKAADWGVKMQVIAQLRYNLSKYIQISQKEIN